MKLPNWSCVMISHLSRALSGNAAKSPESTVRLRLRSLALAGVTLSLLWQASVRADTQPGEPAPNASAAVAPASVAPAAAADASDVLTRDLDWFDQARQRAVPVRLYLPPGADPARALPLVVFSHGIGGSRRGYSYLGRYFASQGYASLHLQHVGSDRSLWAGSMFGLVGRLHGAAQEEEAIARVGDLKFALDQVLGSGELGVKIDATRIVAAGHSYGANTMLLAVGARVERNGRVIELADARLKAAIILSAPPFYGESDPAKILSAIRVPTLHITATEDVIRIPGYYSGAEDRIAVYEAISGARKFLAVFEGGSHSMFTDRGGNGGTTLNPQVKNATRELALAFMRSVFEREEAALTLWPKRFAGILARFNASER